MTVEGEAPMSDVWKKMNLKTESEIVVVNAPESFEGQIAELSGVSVVRNPKKAKAIHFALAFVTKQAELGAAHGGAAPAAPPLRAQCSTPASQTVSPPTRVSRLVVPGTAGGGIVKMSCDRTVRSAR